MEEDLLEANGIIYQMMTAINSGNPLRMNVAVEVAQEYLSRPTKREADLCLICGKNPPVTGKSTCAECVDWFRTSR